MKAINSCEIALVYGGVDKDSEAYKVGEEVGEAIGKIGTVMGFIAGAVALVASGSAS
jgi:hypothetical protein